MITPKNDRRENPNPNLKFYNWLSPRPTHWRDAFFFHSLINKFRPDCLISTFGSVNISTLVGWLNRIPHRVVWYRTLSKQIIADNGNPAWKNNFFRLRKKFVYRFVTQFIANSQAALEDLQSLYQIAAKKCAVFHLLINDNLTAKSIVKTNKIVCVGRLHPSKGQDVLIRAAALLKKSVPSISVEFIGEGSERQNYENLAQTLGVGKECQFVGSVSPDEVLRRMAAAAVCVVPSRNEALGLVGIEAQSVGTPVIGSQIDGIAEVIVNGQTGFLVPPTDENAFAEKIALLLNDGNLREKLGNQAHAHFEEKFNLKNITRHADFFEELVRS